ncbi:MAG: hypothetical protein P1P88_07630, partial [Bacteroidales bacterium]|nr:hypothetical protein [Bacteroidales bacterium]
MNEYYNAQNPSDEWVELLVVSDYINLVNYTLRDTKFNNGMADSWAGGVQFANNDLWRELRAGTVIVINCRGS